ncbi:probable protein phosphatase 2C 4 [Cajanus cajan]|uniref:probable protein phosphatase 2C 4 n=1 Tax=Cajanus cajan TaxID=3821 RepID=UPI00098DAF51|nr:probable protein phosphatase 2C 4 [Cajanus cajan]
MLLLIGDVNVTDVDACSHCVEQENSNRTKKGRNSRSKFKGAAKKWEENQRRWKCEWDRERLELDRRLKEQLSLSRSGSGGTSSINHGDVLEALSRALRKTEESYLDVADKMVMENPELALMGSCVLVMLMKGEDVYVMNVGDSRAVLAQKAEPDYWLGKIRQDLERINEETMNDLESWDVDTSNLVPSLSAIQLTKDHSTSVEEEVQRIKKEHPDDPCAVVNDRVKGSLKVTRAFGAGFLKQPKWNNALLEMFRIDYVGNSPYISCLPYLKFISNWQHCNPSSTNRVATVECHSPAEESKIEDNFPLETALRTSPANPNGVLPVRSCNMMIPKEYMSDLGVSTPVL